MKVYVLIEKNYNYDCEDPTSEVVGIYKNIWKAETERQKLIQDNVNNFDFVRDSQNKNELLGTETIFYNYQENWNNYIEFEIVEKEVL